MDDAFVSNASKIKSSLSPLGLSFLLIHEPREGKGRRWTATGVTRTKFKAEGGIRFSGIELDSKTAIEDESCPDVTLNRKEIASLLEDLLNAVEKMLNEKGTVADSVSDLPSKEKSPEAVVEPSIISNGAAKTSSKIPRGLTRLPSLVEDIRCQEGGDAFLFVEDPEPNRNFWFGTGKLREMALEGQVGFQSEASGNEENEESIPNGDAQRTKAIEAEEEIPNDSSERNENLLLGESKAKSESEIRNSASSKSESRDEESDDDSDIEIIHTVDARPYSSSGSSSLDDDDDSVSRPPSSSQDRPLSKKDRRHSGTKGRSSPVYADFEDEDDIATANQKRKASSDKDESEPADKRRQTSTTTTTTTAACDNDGPRVGPKIFRVDTSKMSDVNAERRRGEGEIAEIVEDSEKKDEDNKNGDYEDDDKDVEDAENHDDDAASSNGSDIEVIGTVSPPPRSRSSSSSRSRSRSRSRSPRSPRGSRSPSPLFTRSFLYSGAPRISSAPRPLGGDGEEDGDDEDDDIEDLTTTDVDDKLYDEEMGIDGDVETDGKDEGDEIVGDDAPPPPIRKGGSIECIEVDDED